MSGREEEGEMERVREGEERKAEAEGEERAAWQRTDV